MVKKERKRKETEKEITEVKEKGKKATKSKR